MTLNGLRAWAKREGAGARGGVGEGIHPTIPNDLRAWAKRERSGARGGVGEGILRWHRRVI